MDDDALRAALASLGSGGVALGELFTDDSWFAHHGSTEAIRGREALLDHVRSLNAAYPGLRFEPGASVALDRNIALVELTMRDDSRDVGARMLAMVRMRRRAIASIELFGADPRGPFPSAADPRTSLPSTPFELESSPSTATAAMANTLGGQSSVRLSARAGDIVFAMIDVHSRTSEHVPLVRHVGALARVEGEGVADVRVFENPREVAPLVIGNRAGEHVSVGDRTGEPIDATIEGDALAWGAWMGLCCEQGHDTRQCDRIRTRDLEACRATRRLAFVCREAYHCTGPDCFCCAHGLDGACSMDHVPEAAEDVPEGRRPPEPSIWSPY
jgi:hypothetical protein